MVAVGVHSQQGKIGLLLQGGGGAGAGTAPSSTTPDVAAGAAVMGVAPAVAPAVALPAGLGKTSFLTEKLDVLARQIGCAFIVH